MTSVSGTYSAHFDGVRAGARVSISLRDDGTFLYEAEWEGYDSASAEGTWSGRGEYVHLSGRGSKFSCTRSVEDEEFECTMRIGDDGSLRPEEDVPIWSLLETSTPLDRDDDDRGSSRGATVMAVRRDRADVYARTPFVFKIDESVCVIRADGSEGTMITTDGSAHTASWPDRWVFLTARDGRDGRDGPRAALSLRVAMEGGDRHEQLRRELAASSYRYSEGVGFGVDDWEGSAEPGFAVLGMGRDEALAFARKYGQDAIVLGEGAKARIVWTDE